MHNKSSKLVINLLLVIAPKTKRHVFTTPGIRYFPHTVISGLKEPLNQQAITKNQERRMSKML
jgi:hypothetical protein